VPLLLNVSFSANSSSVDDPGVKPGEVWGVTIAVLILLGLWLARSWSRAHLEKHERDPRLAHARERRGF